MMVAHPYSSATIAAGKPENEETLKSTEAPKPEESLDEERGPDDDFVPTMTTANTIYQIEPDAKILWNRDGKDGPSDPNNSEAILLNWLMKPGNYALYRNVNGRRKEKERNVLTKAKLVAHIAERMNAAQVRKKRTGQQVQNKLHSIEKGFRAAHNHATNFQARSKTETVDIERIRQKVLSYCRWYFDLLEVFQGQATFASMTAFLQVQKTADDGRGGGGGVNDEKTREQENSEGPAATTAHVLSRKNYPTTTGSSVSVGDHEATAATTKPPLEAKNVGGRKRAASAGGFGPVYGRRTKRKIQTGRKVRACRRLPPREIETLPRGEAIEEEEEGEELVDAISEEENQDKAKQVVLSGESETSGQHHDCDMDHRMKLVQIYGQLREQQWITNETIVKMFPELEPFIAILSGENEL